MVGWVAKVMPRTSASCLQRAEARADGFTLVELLVVLALVAALSALVAPRLGPDPDGAAQRTQLSELERQLQRLPQRAVDAGEPLAFDAERLRALLPSLPAAWRLQVEPALRYGSSGFASGGEVRLLQAGRGTIAHWRIEAVTGVVHTAAAGQPDGS